METRFASPERSTAEKLVKQQEVVERDHALVSVLNAMPDLVMVLNTDRQIVFANAALLAFARSQGCGSPQGLRPGELLACRYARSARCGCGTSEECRECGAVQTILSALSGNKSSAECRILRETPEGPEALDLKVWGTPFRWEGEQFALIVAVDISHEKRRKVLERIFFHDLMNTAGAMDSMTELLLRGFVPFEQMKATLRETARALVEEIRAQRELIAAENNELKPRPGPVSGRGAVEAVASRLRNDRNAEGKEIVVACEEDIGLLTDGILLDRILGNLLKNALEATQPGDTITLDCRREGERVIFNCTNPGVIPPPARAQIFHRSFSTKGGGRGIGTYSVKLLTERYLRGSASFTSTAEEGTTFTVALPLMLPS